MTIQIKDFYPKYPFIRRPDDIDLDTYPNESFDDAIVTKKEFASLKLRRVESVPTKPGEYLSHQKYVSRFVSSTTDYNELLLFHEPGTGKTCTAIAVAEALKADKSSNIRRAMIFAKGEGLLNNFRNELIFRCTDGRYVPAGYVELTELQKTRRTRANVSDFYNFDTFETFAKKLSELTDIQIQNRYENSLIVLDEAHNIRSKGSSISTKDDETDPDNPATTSDMGVSLDIYTQFFRLCHVLKRRKILLLTGTPIRDLPEEFGDLMNLLLPLNQQFENFAKRYIRSNGDLRDEDDIAEKIRGRISYLKAAASDIEKRFVGEIIPPLNHFKLYLTAMSSFQTDAYARAYAEDGRTRSIFISARQASLLVYPDGSYGQKGFNTYVKKLKTTGTYELREDFRSTIGSMNELNRLSSKYAAVIRLLLARPKSNAFVYCQYVNGSGAIVFCKILERYGFSRFTGTETVPNRRRYFLASRQTSSIRAIQLAIDRFNADDNAEGEYCSVIVGSRVLNEGFTLKNIRMEFILTGHWNYAETDQAIARGWRLGSHSALIARTVPNIAVEVFQCVSVSADPTIPSIDVEMYKIAESKDLANKRLERLVKETAFDCPLTIDRNLILGYDGERECDYDRCIYRCSGEIGSPLDTITYNFLSDVQDRVTKEVDEYLRRLFRRRFTISKRDVIRSIADSDEFLIDKALSSLIVSGVTYRDVYDIRNFVKIDDVTDEIVLSAGDASIVYYSQNLIMENRKSFVESLDIWRTELMPDLVQRVFDNPRYARKLIVELPNDVQRVILEGCIMAKYIMKNKRKNSMVRDGLLSFFSGFYSRRRVSGIGNTWIVTLYEDILGGPSCYDHRTGSFARCDITELLGEEQSRLKRSNVGYYGQYNPTLDDFCLRDVSSSSSSSDLRKLTVGRRCVNFDSDTLVDLISRRMKIEPPPSFLIDDNGGSKYAREEDDRATKRRVAYWSTMTKEKLCERMKRWFRSRRLLETNFDCGTQKKRRAKFL